ncbi:cryptochrome/photolyase family protein [Gemmobacter megaterium]|nr:cryptochrome/photolyase family protein [Gemmobacter megaterium]
MTRIVLVLGDQLSRGLSSLRDLDPAHDIVLMAELAEETTYVRHHKQKIALILSAMRHFAAGLRAEGIRVDYIALDDPANTGSFTKEVARAIPRHRPERIIVTEPGEWRVLQMIEGWEAQFGLPVEIREDDRFLCSLAEFRQWAAPRKTLRMEYFYRDMRRRTGFLMQGDDPVGGQWNFDSQNRKALPTGLRPPPRRPKPPDAITQAVLDLVARRFPDTFGDLLPFRWAVTRHGALEALDRFVALSLPLFGEYQDAMAEGEPFLFHALLSPYLNIGLLTAHEVCRAAERAYHMGDAPLNAVEGFIRQIIGWREYVRGIYWMKMPDYARTNALHADRPLPWFYWTGDTAMRCMAQTITDTRRNAYAHHIQRLMVTGNFALLAGIRPAEVEEWYLAVYADAFDWVELPNTHGMVLWADGGMLASKPYAASGAYIDRMSDYCRRCAYDPRIRTGPRACPFNFLYWDFLMRNRPQLAGNPRLALSWRNLDRISPQEQTRIRDQARAFLDAPGTTAPAPEHPDLFG